MNPTKSPPAPDLAERESAASRKLSELRARRASLALDALDGDPKAKKALDEIEQGLAEVEAEVERLHLAASEQERRDAAAQEAAENAAREGALADARALQVKKEAAAGKVDEGIDVFCGAVAAYANICSEQAAALTAAGKAQAAGLAEPDHLRIEGALSGGLRRAKIRGLILGHAMGFQNYEEPLAERDTIAVNPPEEAK